MLFKYDIRDEGVFDFIAKGLIGMLSLSPFSTVGHEGDWLTYYLKGGENLFARVRTETGTIELYVESVEDINAREFIEDNLTIGIIGS